MTPAEKDKEKSKIQEKEKAAESGQAALPPAAADLSVVSLEEEMKRSYLDYAMSVIIGRAIPDIRDGLKPVHRRVLYSMYETGTAHNKPFKKSARIVGDVIGKYHPHGDQAVYDTLVRMAQDFSMRSPLVDGQGNFGSIDGDPPAAMRYTEVRLKKISESLMDDLDKDTVNFVSNYDDSLTMPEVLPAKFPNLLVNGGSGIAVGMATNIPPHNLGEVVDGLVYLVQHPGAKLDKIMEFVPGPDFPTGGQIYGLQGLRAAYRDGRGSITIRAKSVIESGGPKGERERIVITEIPFQVNKAKLLENAAHLVNEKRIEGIADIRDESDRDGMRIVFELKKGELPEVVLNNLYKHTALQTSFGIILLSILDKQPKLLGLIDIMKHFLSHRQDVIRRRTRFELKKAEARAHILEGLTVALDHLDEIITLIRRSKTVEDARNGLITRFRMTSIQAQAILEMQLQRLTNLEREKIRKEYVEVKELIAKLRKILGSEKLIQDIIVEELKQVKTAFGDARRTEIKEGVLTDIKPEDLVKEEEVVVVQTASGYIKRTSLSSYRNQGRGGKGRKGISMKEEDAVEHIFICSTHSYLLVFTSQGRLYWLKALDIPDVGLAARGKSLANLVEFQPGERVTSVAAVKEFSPDCFVLMLSSDGQIKKTALDQFKHIRRGGIQAMSVRPKKELLFTSLTDGKRDIIIGTRLGKAIRFSEKQIRPMGRQAAGVRAMSLASKDAVIGMIVVSSADKFVFTASEKGFGKKTEVALYRRQSRGGKGIINLKVTPKIGPALAMVGISEGELLLMTEAGKVIRIKAHEVRTSGRSTQGVRLIHLGDKDRVCSVAKVAEEE
ncbi:MAG: DNA gyrase subunit A [Candidatus Aminicenantes bacterium]|nr:DNA gyrase subunit A [Candidatus Aminicenantes bacterium]